MGRIAAATCFMVRLLHVSPKFSPQGQMPRSVQRPVVRRPIETTFFGLDNDVTSEAARSSFTR